MFGESPYIGKGRFQQNEYSLEHCAHAKPGEVRHGTVNGSTHCSAVSSLRAAVSQGRLDYINVDGDVNSTTEDKKQQIDAELQDKLCALAEG